jgi:hypothetical protein
MRALHFCKRWPEIIWYLAVFGAALLMLVVR